MSNDPHLFKAPKKYPDAPRDMWYELPPKPSKAERSKPKSIFPWEGRAPKPTRVFPDVEPPSPPPEPESEPEPAAVEEPEPVPSSTTSATLEPEPAVTPNMTSPDPWAGFQQRSNAWDDIPEIERYMQGLQGPRKAKIQVLHNSAVPQPRSPGRRESLKLTDFPTAIERPSLPVTPAPIRRPSFWGEERDSEGNLPAAEGVPKQAEWVRRFSSYPVPDFSAALPATPLLQCENDVLVMRCQYCGKQNPIAKLEELQRKQSEVLAEPTQLQAAASVPERMMPESDSREAVEKATEHALSPPAPKVPKPILKSPSFEVPKKAQDDFDVPSPTSTRSGSNRPVGNPFENMVKDGAPNPASEETATV